MSSKNSRYQTIFIISLAAGVMVLAGGVLQVSSMLSYVGVNSVFSALSLADSDKVNFALYLTFPGACFAIILWAGASIFKGYTRRGSMIACLSVVFGIVALFLPFALGYTSSAISLAAMALAAVLMGAVAFAGFRLPGVEVKEMFLTPVEIAVVSVFSALTAVLTGTTGVMFPSPTLAG